MALPMYIAVAFFSQHRNPVIKKGFRKHKPMENLHINLVTFL